MSKPSIDLITVGAGLTGLNLAREIQTMNPHANILILEKSKSCGGRMATRRVGESKFDHGAQFIKNTITAKKLLDFWQQEQVIQKFPTESFSASCGHIGMTQLAKKLAENVNISYTQKVISLEKAGNTWKVMLESGESLLTSQVVLTCPLPQSLDILKQSKIVFDSKLADLNYNKALVQLVQFDKDLGPESIYAENVDQNIFSVISQRHKGMSSLAEYTIVMTPLWSEMYFEQSEEEILKAAENLLKQRFPQKNILSLQIKKWRYAQPDQTWSQPFENPAEGLYLAGDAFGGPSLKEPLKALFFWQRP